MMDLPLSTWLLFNGAGRHHHRTEIVSRLPNGEVHRYHYGDFSARAQQLMGALGTLGLAPGDRVATLGWNHFRHLEAYFGVPCSGRVLHTLNVRLSAEELAFIMNDADDRAVLVDPDFVPLLEQVRPLVPGLRHVIVMGGADEVAFEGALAYDDLLREEKPAFEAGRLDEWAPAGICYTSGTTGRPKGAVHTHAGFLAKTASEVAYSFDVGPGSVFCWITDMGWIMGPLSIVGTHANGATLLLYEGSPDVPDSDRLWDLVERHGVTMLGVSPSLARAIRSSGGDGHRLRDLRTVHTIGSTGEPWDESAYDWLARDVFGSRVPIINFSGGTEVGGSFLAPYPVEPIKSCSLGGPSLGMDVDVVDASGRPVRGEVGELVCRQPWPSMTRGIWRDEERYLESYWSTFPGVWRHGDFSMVDAEGQWFVLGRSDDVMNVAGKRLAPAEVEAVIATHPAVAEVAAVGVPDPDKGEAVWAVWVAVEGVTEDVSAALRAIVANELGKPFAPARVCRVPQLPKTRSAKILRRAVRAAALGTDPGDLSGAENPEAVEEIRAALASDA